jgi:hypothetical protein
MRGQNLYFHVRNRRGKHVDKKCIKGNGRNESNERVCSIEGGDRNSSGHTEKVHGKCVNKELDVLEDLFKTPLVAPISMMGIVLVVLAKFVGISPVYWQSWLESRRWRKVYVSSMFM